ncbi:MFS transporter [Sphingomonas sp. AP4-R1]|uniref:MFS transporter n=1 Tax=Sphingomonas sp. AP4-R1 TaxID=2735134 RepID=UPI001493326F|nr:MFS transporter [Sphingomonas sp. AP4-R1]QJU58775.1 MFS transporter [Sphingomonas sp. AP4-R1]
MEQTHEPAGLDAPLMIVLAVACGMMVANLYFAQALVGEIAPALQLSPALAGLIVTLTQLGYGAGLFFVVSLADLLENRRLILITTAGACLSEFGIFFSTGATSFLIFSCLAGICSVGAQIMVPLAAHLAPEHSRGRVVGNIMGGLIAGIMLARPLASGLAALAGWRTIFGVSGLALAVLFAVLAVTLPERRPPHRIRYGEILRSGLLLLARTRIIQRRTAYQAAMFAAFNLFWTAVPLVLASRFHLGQGGIALFALAGAGGALTAPIAGRLGDRGHIRTGTAAALAGCIAAFALAGWAEAVHLLLVLAAAAILLDAATQMNQVLGQRILYSIAPEARGRINAVYMTVVFLAGATGSMLATVTLEHGGWSLTAIVGAAIGTAALLLFATEPHEARTA